jgi:hypothetical protein
VPSDPIFLRSLGLFPQSFVAISNTHRYMSVILEAVRRLRPGFSLNDQFDNLGTAKHIVNVKSSLGLFDFCVK